LGPSVPFTSSSIMRGMACYARIVPGLETTGQLLEGALLLKNF